MLEENILSLTDGMAETVLRMRSMKSYCTLFSTASLLHLYSSGCQVILVYFYLSEQYDKTTLGQLVLVAVLVPVMMPRVLRLCRQFLYFGA